MGVGGLFFFPVGNEDLIFPVLVGPDLELFFRLVTLWTPVQMFGHNQLVINEMRADHNLVYILAMEHKQSSTSDVYFIAYPSAYHLELEAIF